MFGEIRNPDEPVSSPAKMEYARKTNAKKRAITAAKHAAAGTTPKVMPQASGRPKSVVNRVTEYGALFNKLNEERIDKGLSPLKTAMEVLIDAMQSNELDIKDKAKIADKLASFESSRAPIISIEHVNNVTREEEPDSEEALSDFLNALKKI